MTPPEYAAAVAVEIRAEMGRQKKSQADLARALDITPATAARRLSGEAPLDLAELMQVALWLGVPVDQFAPRLGEVSA